METISRHASSVALLVVLLFSFFAMMSYQVNRADTISSVEGTVQTMVSPLHRLISSAWLGISDGWFNYVAVFGRASEADALRDRIGVLERRAATLEEAARENARLRQLLGLRDRLDLPSMAARTIGRDLAHGYEAFTINRGTRDGVMADWAVLSPTGNVVGRVVNAAPYSANVQLITDAKSAVGAKVARTGAHGVVHGTGGAIMELAYVTSLADVQVGDLVVTSGDDSIYPPGLEIGRVSRVVKGAPVPGLPRLPTLARAEAALFLDIELEPLVEVRWVDQVLLLAPASGSDSE
jgi:rod shape-determining protein MreC